MNEAQRIATAQRANAAYAEFIEPMIDALKEEYSHRIVEVANSELSRDKRADMLTALSIAHKILTTLDGGMKTMIADAEVAIPAKIRADKIAEMTKPQRRLLNIGNY